MQIAVQQRARIGEKFCGDAVLQLKGDSTTLIAVVDGLGHGEKAAAAAALFCDCVREHQQQALERIMQAAHKKLRGKRGVVATLLRIDHLQMRISVVGLGNISLRSRSVEPIKPISFPGVIGSRMRKIKAFEYALHRGDLLVLFSDGISSSLNLDDYKLQQNPDMMASQILHDHGKDHDDATVVVVSCDAVTV